MPWSFLVAASEGQIQTRPNCKGVGEGVFKFKFKVSLQLQTDWLEVKFTGFIGPQSFKRHWDRQVLMLGYSMYNFVPTILKTNTACIYFICTTGIQSPNLCSQYTIMPSSPSIVGKFHEHLNCICHSMYAKWFKKYPFSILHNLDLLLQKCISPNFFFFWHVFRGST